MEKTFEFSVVLSNFMFPFFLYFSIVCCSFSPDLCSVFDLVLPVVCCLGALGLFISLLNSLRVVFLSSLVNPKMFFLRLAERGVSHFVEGLEKPKPTPEMGFIWAKFQVLFLFWEIRVLLWGK